MDEKIALRFGTTGHIYPNPAGYNASTSGYDVVYNIPTAYRAGSIWLSHGLNGSAGYFDVYLRHSGYTTGNQDIWYKRVNNHYTEGYMRSDSPNHVEYAGQRFECVASAYAPHFDQIVIKGKKGRYTIVAVSFSASPYNDVGRSDWVHSDNIIGDPSSLSDTRIKQNQEIASQDNLCKVFDDIDVKVYDRIENDDSNDTEHRLGFIAQDVQQAIYTHMPDMNNIISERPVGDENLLQLDYSRLVCVLWAKVKQLEQRLSVLKNI